MLKEVHNRFREITEYLISHNITISTMESCTAGMIASLLTDTEGASEVFKGSIVTYSNEAKEIFGVSPDVIGQYGVYSQETANEMATVCRIRFNTDIGIGITGTFGNKDPNNVDSIPGIVYFSVAARNMVHPCRLELKEQPERFQYKLSVARKLAEDLFTILKRL